MTSGITYAGKVSIKIKGKPQKRCSNNGTYVLLDFIGNCLINAFARSFVDYTRQAPTYIDILLQSVSSDTQGTTKDLLEANPNCYATPQPDDQPPLRNYSVLRAPVLIEDKKLQHSDEKHVTTEVVFTALVNTSNVNDTILDHLDSTAKNLFVCLVDAQQENILAFAEIEVDPIKSLTSDVFGQATVDWTMEIGNKELN